MALFSGDNRLESSWISNADLGGDAKVHGEVDVISFHVVVLLFSAGLLDASL